MLQSSQVPSEHKLQAIDVSHAFSRGGKSIEVLRDINLSVRSGEFVALVGASGCGKTTLLRIIHGLVTARQGEIRVDGRIVQKPAPDRGFVFQSDCLLPWRTVEDNVIFGLELQGRDRQVSKQQAQSLIELVGLKGFEQHHPHELSGGMRQRVNLARALAVDPGVLLMDEPFAALDAQTRELMQRELLRIWSEYRKTVLFVTHQIDEAVYLSDRVVVLTSRPGRVKAILNIDIPRPRPLHVKRTVEFGAYVDQIWQWIEAEVEASMI